MGGEGSGRHADPFKRIIAQHTTPINPNVCNAMVLPNYSGLKEGVKKTDGEVYAKLDGTNQPFTGRVTAPSLTVDTNTLYVDGANHRVGFGTTAPESALDIINPTIIGQLRLSTNKTDSTVKFGGVTTGHYLNAEEPFLMMMGSSGATENYINFGGGSSTANTCNIIRFYTTADNTTITGTERMRIQPTGRVGIGITAPTSMFHVVGSADIPQFTIKANATQTSDVFNALNSSGNKLLSLNSSGALTVSAASTAVVNTNTVGSLEFYTYDSSNITNRTVARIKAVAEGDYVGTDNAKTAITFETHGATGDSSEKMRITNAGNVGIGTTAPSEVLDVNGNIIATGYKSSDGSAGLSVTIVTAQLTALGSQGSMTFKNGILTAQTAAT